MLQAEEDRDLVRRHWADIEREKMLLGTETKVYHSNRYEQLCDFRFSMETRLCNYIHVAGYWREVLFRNC